MSELKTENETGLETTPRHKAVPNVLVIGTVSVDRLHLADESTHWTLGGAGLYTALAASRAGAAVTLLAPRPSIFTGLLRSVEEKLDWIGPAVDAEDMPLLEIAHYGNGRAELLSASWGAEVQLTVDQLPADLADFDVVHIAALRSARRQFEFLGACRTCGAKSISVGSYAQIINDETKIVRSIVEAADLFFMNENEANGLFGSLDALKADPPQFAAKKKIFVTLGADGVCVLDGERIETVDGTAATDFDPTGAGDTFCGTALTKLAQGSGLREAAEAANVAAARMIEEVGPTALLA